MPTRSTFGRDRHHPHASIGHYTACRRTTGDAPLGHGTARRRTTDVRSSAAACPTSWWSTIWAGQRTATAADHATAHRRSPAKGSPSYKTPGHAGHRAGQRSTAATAHGSMGPTSSVLMRGPWESEHRSLGSYIGDEVWTRRRGTREAAAARCNGSSGIHACEFDHREVLQEDERLYG